MSTNLEHIQKEKDREKEKVGDRPAKLNEKKSDRELEREIKNKGDIFCWKNNMKRKKKRQWPPRWKWAAVKKKSEQEHVLHFLVKTGNQRKPGSFWKFYVVVVQNNGKKCTKKCAARAKLLFLLIRPIVVFSPSSLPSPLSITRLYILYEHWTINTIESFAFYF